MSFFGGLGQMLTRLSHLSQLSAAFGVVISGGHVFPSYGMCQGPRLRAPGHPPLLPV